LFENYKATINNLYDQINEKFYELDLDQISLESSVNRMFKNKYITKNNIQMMLYNRDKIEKIKKK
jgi:hypothetical protein